MRTAVFLFGGLLAVLLAGCEDQGEYRAETFVFGTSVGMQIRGTKVDVADQAFADISKRFQFMHEDWHAWEPGILTDINGQLAIGRQAHAPPDILLMIQRAKVYEERSEGMFNPAAGGLVELWGFHTSEWPVYRQPPGDSEIAEWLQSEPRMADIEVKGNILSSENRAVQLDFGGLAKGHAVDLAMQVFDNHDIRYALVNAGGDLRARGSGRQPWKIGIMDGAGGILGSVNIISDEAVFTSAVDQRFMEDEDARMPHVLDPRTGRPIAGLRSATVIARSGILADAAATALLVAGVDDWERIAEQMGIEEALVVTDEGQVIVTVPMEGRVQWLGQYADTRKVAGS